MARLPLAEGNSDFSPGAPAAGGAAAQPVMGELPLGPLPKTAPPLPDLYAHR
jgi:hypothetical protein